MSFWMGFNEAWEKDKDRKLKETLLDKQLLEKRKDRMFSLVGSRLEKSKKRETPAAKINVARQRLKQYGVDGEVIDRMEDTGDIDGMMKVVSDLEGLHTGYKAEGRPVPTDTVNTYLEGIVMSPATVAEVDFGAFDLSELGLTDEEREAISYETVPGAISAEPPVVVSQPSLEDLSRVEKMAAGSVAERAAVEAKRLQASLNKLDQLQESGEATDEQKADREFLVDRYTTVKNAMEAGKGDDATYVPLISLYGSEYFNSILKEYPQFQNSPFSPAFTENMGQTIPTVKSPEQANRLWKTYGALKPGDYFYYEEPYTDDSGELVDGGVIPNG